MSNESKQEYKPLASLWVTNSYAIGLLLVFMSAIGVLLVIGYGQIVGNGEYAAESFAAINNVIVFLLGTIAGIVGSVIFGLEPTELKDMTKNAGERAKENFMLDAPTESPNTDEI